MSTLLNSVSSPRIDARHRAVLGAIVLSLIIILRLLRFVRKVVRIRKVSQMSAVPVFEPMQFEQLPLRIREALAEPAPALAAREFRVAAYAGREPGSGSRWYHALWVRRATGDMATISAADSLNGKPAVAVHPMVVLETRLANGMSIVTSGGAALLREAGPEERWLICPEVRDAGDLYNVHRCWVSSNSPTDRVGVLPPAGEELAAMQREALAERRRLVGLAYWRQVTDETLQLTWKGAWLLVRRMRPAAKLARLRQATSKLESLGFWRNGSPRPQGSAFGVLQTGKCPVGHREALRVTPVDESE